MVILVMQTEQKDKLQKHLLMQSSSITDTMNNKTAYEQDSNIAS